MKIQSDNDPTIGQNPERIGSSGIEYYADSVYLDPGEELPPEFQINKGEKVQLDPAITFSFTHGSRELPDDTDAEGISLYELSDDFNNVNTITRLSDFATVGEHGNPGIRAFFPSSANRIWVPNFRLSTNANRDGTLLTVSGEEGVRPGDELIPLVDIGGAPMYKEGNAPSKETLLAWAKHPRGAAAYQRALKAMLRNRLDTEDGPIIHGDIHDGRDVHVDAEDELRYRDDGYKSLTEKDEHGNPLPEVGVPLMVFSDMDGKASSPGLADRLAEISTQGFHFIGVEQHLYSDAGVRIWPEIRANDPYKGKAIMQLIVELKEELIQEGRPEDAARLFGFQIELNASMYAFLDETNADALLTEAVQTEAMVLGYTFNTLAKELRRG